VLSAVTPSTWANAAVAAGACGIVAEGMMGDDEPREAAPITKEEQQVLLHVIELLRKLSYGTILLVVQDGKVVQIETAEKIRLK
jgi:hypothetical protein